MKELNKIEREIWISFHEFAYKDDLKLSKELIEKHPRWSIISGYYAMHDITKLYLGKIHNIKISGFNVHKQVIDSLKDVLKLDDKKLIELLENAENEIKGLGIEDIPYLLVEGKKERAKVQYYFSNVFSDNKEYVKKAKEFFEELVVVFVKIMEDLINVS